MQCQGALELQINTSGVGVENETGSSSLGEELGLPKHDVTPLSPGAEFDAVEPNPSPNPKFCPAVNNREVEREAGLLSMMSLMSPVFIPGGEV